MTESQQLEAQAKESLSRAVHKALETKRRLGQYAIIVQDETIMRVLPDNTTVPEIECPARRID